MEKKRCRKMRQQCCNIDNYQRMRTQAGEQASKEAEKQAWERECGAKFGRTSEKVKCRRVA